MSITFDNKISNLTEIHCSNSCPCKFPRPNKDCPSNYGLYDSNCQSTSYIQCWENALEIAKQ